MFFGSLHPYLAWKNPNHPKPPQKTQWERPTLKLCGESPEAGLQIFEQVNQTHSIHGTGIFTYIFVFFLRGKLFRPKNQPMSTETRGLEFGRLFSFWNGNFLADICSFSGK